MGDWSHCRAWLGCLGVALGLALDACDGRVPAAAAHLLAGLAFAGHHLVIAGVYAGWGAGVALGLLVGAAGVVWSVLARRHGGLAGAWIAHACCDAALLALGWRAITAI